MAGGQRVHIRLSGFKYRLLGGQLCAQLLQRRSLGAGGAAQQQRKELGLLRFRRAGRVQHRLHSGRGGGLDADLRAQIGRGGSGGDFSFGGNFSGAFGFNGFGGGLGLLQRFNLGGQAVHRALGRVAGVDGDLQLAAHIGELGLVGGDVAL